MCAADPEVDSPIKTSLILTSLATRAVPLTVSDSTTPATLVSLKPKALTSSIVPVPPV